ncbi:MAG: putative Zn-dependent hydrolase of beta-lactamase fold family [Micrococcaceae bacterium]|nr:putative Zn-dependent hydrolase of beta-lactamase fold family [Micrococcaceae bacterium]
MKLTKYTHACIRLDKDGKALVLDPGIFSESEEALRGADAVLVTHEHPDHLDTEAVVKALTENPDLTVHAPAGVASALRQAASDATDRITDAVPGTDFTVAGFAVRAYGGQHALIHASVPVVANVGYIIDQNVYHPGDSFIVPDGLAVRTLLVPIHAPWSKTAEVADFVVAVRAERAFQIHDGLLNEKGLGFTESHVTRIGARYGTEFRHLAARESVEI